MTSTGVLIGKYTAQTGNTGTVTFSNIPQNFRHLRLVMSARTDRGATVDGVNIRFNDDNTDANYPSIRQYVIGTGPLVASTEYMFAGYVPGTSIGTNTFSNSECIILDYTSSRTKSLHAWTNWASSNLNGFQSMDAGKWTGTSAITKIVLTGDLGNNFVAFSTFMLYGIADSATASVTKPSGRGGDIVQNDGNYWYHAFLADGTFTLNTPKQVEAVVIAGGGGGGGHGLNDKGGAGGGAGGVVYRSLYLDKGTYAVTVGAGGSGGGTVNTEAGTKGGTGGNSTFAGLTALGGGGGAGGWAGSGSDHTGATGGSAGGSTKGGSSASGTAGQGNDGAVCDIGSVIGIDNGSGGGGAGSAGYVASTTTGGQGGLGTTAWAQWASATNTGNSSSLTYAGGGGGGVYTGTAGSGGAGGGGAGGATGASGVGGSTNTGGGGGGAGGGANAARAGSAGGSGIVLIRYSR